MKRILRNVVYNQNSPKNVPSAYVEPEEIFWAETELCTGDWLKDINDKWSPEKTKGANPCVCIGIKGAKPGDILKIDILDIIPGTLAHMALETYESVFPDIAERIFGPLFSNTLKIESGMIYITEDIKIPVSPMIGTLSTTMQDEVRTHIWAGRYGGNLDIQEIRAGASVYLPVYMDGALLNIGDVHASQSDGEISAVECRSEVKMKVSIEKDVPGFKWPRITDAHYLISTGCAKTERQAFEIAFSELLAWLNRGYHFSEQEAYMLLAAAMEARCTVYLNPYFFTYVCKIKKKYLDKIVSADASGS